MKKGTMDWEIEKESIGFEYVKKIYHDMHGLATLEKIIIINRVMEGLIRLCFSMPIEDQKKLVEEINQNLLKQLFEDDEE